MGWWTGEPMCQGDQGADVIDEALERLDAIWQEAWGRRIKKDEVLALVDFCHQEDDGEEFDLHLSEGGKTCP